MTNPNIGWLYYKDYYSGAKYNFQGDSSNEKKEKARQNLTLLLKKNKNILEEKVNANDTALLTIPNVSNFTLKTTNPGLLIGSGYNHKIGVEGEFKIGFFFDHTVGVPLIPASSVKGLLRSAFPQRNVVGKKQKHQNGKEKFIKQLLSKINPLYADINIDHLEQFIFDGINPNSSHEGDKFLSTYNRIIFYDAIVKKSDDTIFYEDFITHHKNKLKDPDPIMFLKIKPNVEFIFQFGLKSIKFGEIEIKPNDLEQLFKSILKILGIGAKTNVGYGALSD